MDGSHKGQRRVIVCISLSSRVEPSSPLFLSLSLSLSLSHAHFRRTAVDGCHTTHPFFYSRRPTTTCDAIFTITDLLPLRTRRARVHPPGKHRRRPCAVTRLSHDTSVRRGRRWQSEPVAPRAPAPSRTNGRPLMRRARARAHTPRTRAAGRTRARASAAALQRRPEYHGTGIRAPTARTHTRTRARAEKPRG